MPYSSSTQVARKVTPIVPSDTVTITCHAIMVGVGGVLTVLAEGDTVPVPITVQAGQMVPIACQKVMATGTTASGLVALAV